MSDNQREAGTIILDPTHASFAPEETVHDLGATHFIGIGGAGMSVLAEMLHEQGVEVDGSDREPSAKTDRLQSLGITVEFGQQATNRTAASPNTIRKSPSSPIPKPTTLTTTARRTIIGPHSWTMPDTPPKP